MVTIDRHSAHHAETNGRYAVKPKTTGNAAKLGADVLAMDYLHDDEWDEWFEDRKYARDDLAYGSQPLMLTVGAVWRGRVVTESARRRNYLDLAKRDADSRTRSLLHVEAIVSPSAELSDDTQIDRYGTLLENVRTRGRVRIGRNCGIERDVSLRDVDLRHGVSIGELSRIGVADTDTDMCVIGHGTRMGAHTTILGKTHIGERNTIDDRVTLSHVTTGKGVRISERASIADVHISDGAFIAAHADIQGPGDLFTISTASDDGSRPTVVAHRVRMPEGFEGPRHYGQITICSRDTIFTIDIGDTAATNELFDTLAIHDDLDRFRDSADGTQDGILSILEDTERFWEMRRQMDGWWSPRAEAPHVT